MKSKLAITAGVALALLALTLASTAVASAAGAGVKVQVRVEGSSGTVLSAKTVRLRPGWVVKAGHGRGICPLASAQGALALATHGRWSGKWYASYGQWEIRRILGVHPLDSKHWWELLVNGREAQTGACEQALKRNDHVVFALVAGDGEEALGARAPRTVASGANFTVHVFYYDPHGRRHRISGATVSLGHSRAHTGSSGTASLRATGDRRQTLRISRHGYIRCEERIRVG